MTTSRSFCSHYDNAYIIVQVSSIEFQVFILFPL